MPATWIGATEVGRQLGMSRQMVHRLDHLLCPEWETTPGGMRRKRYVAAHIQRIASQRARAQAERDSLSSLRGGR